MAAENQRAREERLRRRAADRGIFAEAVASVLQGQLFALPWRDEVPSGGDVAARLRG